MRPRGSTPSLQLLAERTALLVRNQEWEADQLSGALGIGPQSTGCGLAYLAGAIGLTAGTSLRVTWAEVAVLADANAIQRYIAVDLSDLEAGSYRLVVRVRRADGSLAEAARLLEVARPAR